MKLVLLHSPLTGPATWRPVAPLLEARGHDVCVPDYRSALAGPPPYYGGIAQKIARQADGASVLIVHSGAGALVPSVVAAAHDRMGAAIFVDALLPHPGKCWLDTIPEDMAARVRGLETRGWLPPWNCWWPKRALEAMLPDDATRAAFVAELPSLRMKYFEEHAPDIYLPKDLSCAYLQLSSGYDAEIMEAQILGWPTQRLDLNHLGMLTRSDAVADEIEGLLRATA